MAQHQDRDRLQRHGLRHAGRSRCSGSAPKAGRAVGGADCRRRARQVAIRWRVRCRCTRSASRRGGQSYIDWILSPGRPEDRRGERLRAALARWPVTSGGRRRGRAAAVGSRAGRTPPSGGRSPRRLAERALEALIRLSGVSAIFFVLAIFFFIFREAAPVLFSRGFKPLGVPVQHPVVPDLRLQRSLRHAGAHDRHAERHRRSRSPSRSRSAWALRSTSPSSAARSSKRRSRS